MLAYHSKRAIKTKYLTRVRAHAKADQIVKGQYWERGKGCAVGCTIHGSDHAEYETQLGIPQMIARLEDRIFEGLPDSRAQKWPAQFLSAIRVGADLSRVGPRFLLAIQERRLAALAPETFGVRAAMEQVIAVLRAWADTGSADESAESAARSAACAAASAAWSAESAARSGGVRGECGIRVAG